MKRAVLGNKQLKIPDEEAAKKAAEGFDIYDAEGKTLEIPGAGRTVPFARYFELEQQNKALEEENARLEADAEKLAQEVKKLKAATAKRGEEKKKPPDDPNNQPKDPPK